MGVNAPNIRFKGFTDGWEQRKLSEGVSEIGDGLHGTPTYSDNGNVYFINGNNLVDGRIVITPETKMVDEKQQSLADKTLDETTILMSINGTIGNLAYYSGENLMLGKSAAYIKISDYDKCYIYAYLQSPSAHRYFMDSLTGTTIKNLGLKAIRDMNLIVPQDIDEQEKIGSFFYNLDNLITLHQGECDEAKELKKYMLQKMFPQEGQSAPEIRFAGFTDDWEVCKFGNLADYKKGPFGSALKKDIFVQRDETTVKVYEQQNAISKDWKLERYFITKEYAQKLSGFKICGGDIIVSCAGTIGEIYEIPMDAESGIINQALMRIKVNEAIIDKRMFIILFSNMIDDFTRVHSNGSAIKNIPPFSDLKQMEVLIPKMEEQKKISEYFSIFDNLIIRHQRKCDEMSELKKYILQNMFPQ